MTERPFLHKEAYVNVKSNFIFQDQFAKIFLKIINKKGVYNIGGKSQSIYNFARSTTHTIKKKLSKWDFPLKQNMNIDKLNKILKWK